MRELTFTIEFESGADPLMDRFIEQPELAADAVAACVRRDRFWRIERFAGPRQALDGVEGYWFDDGPPATGEDSTHERLERSRTTLVVYTFIERLHTRNSVPALAARHLDLGHVFQTQRRDDRQRWRLLMRSDENVDVFYDALRTHLPDDRRLSMGRLGDVERWEFDSTATISLPREQRDTVRAAIEHGYYETPRKVTVEQLADRLDVPASTVSYRLRAAEATLAKGYFRRSVAGDGAPAGRTGSSPGE